MSSFAQERVILSLTSQSFALCQKLARIESESALYLALDDIVADIVKNCEIDAAAMVIRKPNQESYASFLHDIHGAGISPEEKKKLSFFLAKSVVPEISQRVRPILRQDVKNDVLGDQGQNKRSKMVSMLAVPMLSGGEAIGILVVFRAEINGFCEEDATFFARVANLVAEDVEHSGAYLRLARDPVTGFYNRRIFFEALAHETARARRYQAPLSAIVLEVDPAPSLISGTKKTLEQFLKKFSQRILSETRQSDIVARISDTSFSFLQPMTQGQSAVEFAKRLCDHFRQHPLTINESVVPMKICAGVSSLGSEDDDGSAMLMRADSALNAARKKGQGEVVIQ